MRFRLLPHFTLTSLVFFIVAGSALGIYYRETALSGMLRQQESANVNVTRVFANNLWDSEFTTLLNSARDTRSPDLRLLSQIPEIHRKVSSLMRGSTTYKIKVYDTQGRTVYSSELSQIGEDKSNNPGFIGAMRGHTKTELVHKEKFSAFEQLVENRDLIQSYIPQYTGDSKSPAGVFEIYSDVTPFIEEMRATETRLAIAIATAFGALFTALFVIVRRAAGIIRMQAEDNKRTQQHLAQAEKMSSLGQLVAGVSHQLNTPIAFSHSNINLAISTIRSFHTPLLIASRLAELVRATPESRNHATLNLNSSRAMISRMSVNPNEIENTVMMLGDALTGLEQMRELVENLRDFTRLDRSKVINTDLNATLKTVIYIARSSIPSGIEIEEHFGTLPTIACNASQLNQVFLNLITNAGQAIGQTGKITITTEQSGFQILITFSDNGAGIPAEVLPKIFDTYFTTKPKGVGTGLGLPIARDIVRNHGGEISVQTQVGHGTSFTVSLPINAPDTILEI